VTSRKCREASFEGADGVVCSTTNNPVTLTNHPVCAGFGGFAKSDLWRSHPSLSKEGSLLAWNRQQHYLGFTYVIIITNTSTKIEGSMSRQHSVQTHLNVTAVEYDRLIRTVIPDYEEMLSTISWWLSQIVPTDGSIIDLGGGTGSLAHSVLRNLPHVRLEIWDVDRQMLAVARDRLQMFDDRITLRERSFTETLDACNGVMATLSLHHLHTLDEKRSVYTAVFEALTSPGIFLIGDCAMDPTEPAQSILRRYWTAFMGQHGITEAEAHKHFSDWNKEDTYQQIFDELQALCQAGFQHPEVFWRKGPMTVYGGIKSA